MAYLKIKSSDGSTPLITMILILEINYVLKVNLGLGGEVSYPEVCWVWCGRSSTEHPVTERSAA
jgi:hypothetical protein